MVTTMALSQSLSKLVDKVNENVSKLKEREYIHSNHGSEDADGRPGSPFFLLLSEGDEEFNLNQEISPRPTPDDTETRATTQPVASKPTAEIIHPSTRTRTDGQTSVGEETLPTAVTPNTEHVTFSTFSDHQEVSFHISTPSSCGEPTSTHDEPSPIPTLDKKEAPADARKVSTQEEENSTKSCPKAQLLTKEEFDRLFDHSGRLVNEHELRQTIFKHGIHDNVRKQVWQFLFELYPFNTTAREREILKVEQTVRYEAMKIRWKKLLKTLVNDYEGVAYCPKWFTGCTKPKSTPRNVDMDGEDVVERNGLENMEGCQSVDDVGATAEEELEPVHLLGAHQEQGLVDSHMNETHDGTAPVSETTEQNYHLDHNHGVVNDLSPLSFSTIPPSSNDPKNDPHLTQLSLKSLGSPAERVSSCSRLDVELPTDDRFCKSSTSDRTLSEEDGTSSLPRRLSSDGNVRFGSSTESPSSNYENSADPRQQQQQQPHQNSSSDDNCDCEQLNDSLTLSTDRLEKLPPWIAQMINASTLPTHKCKKKNKLKGKQKSSTTKYPCDDFIRAMDEETTKRKELLDIVENANKFLKERENIVNTPKIRTTDTTPTGSGKDQVDAPKALPEVPSLPASGIHSGLFGYEQKDFEVVIRADDIEGVDCPYCNESDDKVAKITLTSSVVGEDQLKFMQLQAQVYAARQSYDANRISESVRVIDKDVPRTDRELETFSGNDNVHLVELRDALLTYAFFNPDVGYAQGMNDIMARFLVVMKKESEAYWMFVRYMDHFKHHFMEEGMLEKITLVEQLLHKMDKDLHDYLHTTDMGLMFCHRWLLLNFKREFEYHESLRIFEITSSRHLEVSSLQAELERSKQRAEEFVQGSAGSHLEEVYISPEIPFDIFICVAMLMEVREVLMATSDVSRIYEILSHLPNTLDLEVVLQKSEQLFYQYCRRTVVDCFQVIDDVV